MEVIKGEYMKLTLATILLTISLSGWAGHHEGHQEHKEAFQACAQEAGLTEGQKPSKDQKQKIRSCLEKKGIKRPERKKLDESTKTAIKACREELGLKRPERGEKPSKEMREKMKACLQGKGITPPSRGE